MPKKYIATLIRGNTYTYGGKQFKNGVPSEPIDEETKEYLEENAVKIITDSEGDVTEKAKFRFEEAEEGSDDGKGRKRSRPSR